MTNSNRNDIHAIRGLSVLLVVLYHAGVPYFGYGYLGVDIFFVLSGYFVSQQLYQIKSRSDSYLLEFYQRRFVRVAPSLIVVVIFGLILSHLVLFPRDYTKAVSAAGASFIGLANSVLMNQSSGYFAESLKNHPFLHLWSLSVEFQYYLIFPLLLILVKKRLQNPIPLFTAIGFLSALFAITDVFVPSESARFFLLPFRLYEFMLGALAWEFRQRSDSMETSPLRMGHQRTLLVIGLGLISALCLSVTFIADVGPHGIHTVCLALLIALLLRYGHSAWGVSFTWLHPLLYLGTISYALYLFHQPILAIQREMWGEAEKLYTATAVAVSIVLAHVVTNFLETPLRRCLGKKGSGYRLLGAYSTAFVCVAALFFYVKETRGLPERFDGVQRTIAQTAVDSPLGRQCHTDGEEYRKPAVACEYFGQNTTWAVLGDSHGITIAYALARELEKTNESVKHLTFSGCSVPWGEPGTPCEKWTNEALSTLYQSPHIKSVVLAYRIYSPIMGRHEHVYPAIPDNKKTKSQRLKILKKYSLLISHLRKMGKNVYFLDQVPEVGPNLKVQMRTTNNGNAISVTRDWWSKRTEFFTKNKSLILDEGAIYIDPTLSLCDEKNCYSILNGVSNYYDRDHLSVEGARRVIAPIID